MSNLSHKITKKEHAVVVGLSGKITCDADYEQLQLDLNQLIGQGNNQLILDLTKLTHTNSSGIALFMRTLTKCRVMGGDMVLAGVNGNVLKVFEITKLTDVYTIFSNVDNAVNHYIHSA